MLPAPVTTSPAPSLGATSVSLGSVLRSFQARDMRPAESLLSELPLDYPAGDVWLRNRLHDCLEGAALCELATSSNRSLLGVTIVTPKRPTVAKLSTIFVRPDARGRRVGSALLDSVLGRTAASGIRELYVTVAHHKIDEIAPLLIARGFAATAFEPNRYGRGRHEVVYCRLTA